MKQFLFLVTIIAKFSLPSSAQMLNVARLDSFLNALSSRGLVMGSLAIADHGVVKYQKAMGYAHANSMQKIPADIHTEYRIGSITKMFTATLIFQLVEEKKLSLSTKLAVYFPQLPNASAITIKDMLYHRSGLHDYTHDTGFESWMDKPTTQQEQLQRIQTKGSDFPPGTTADYSNSNYLLLGYIVEKITGMPYAQALQKRVCSKAGLHNTYMGWPANATQQEAVSYKWADSSWHKEKQSWLPLHGGAGSLVSTPADLVAFINALFTGKLVSASSLANMKTLVDGYGMGMFADKYGSQNSFGHNGRVEEFYSAAWYYPAKGLSFSYCANGIQYPRQDLLDGVLKICFNEAIALPFAMDTTTSPDNDNKYLGTYKSGQLTVTVTRNGARLLVETRGKVFETEKVNEGYYMNAANGYYFVFDPQNGSLQIKETDNVYNLKRSPTP